VGNARSAQAVPPIATTAMTALTTGRDPEPALHPVARDGDVVTRSGIEEIARIRSSVVPLNE